MRLNHSTDRTNIIDLYPFLDGGTLYGIFKNETTKYVEIGSWSSATPSAQFSLILTNDHSSWGQYREAPWVFKRPSDGKYVAGLMRYQREGTDGLSYAYSISSTLTSGWSSLTNISAPYGMQFIIPMEITNATDHANALAAISAGSGLAGKVTIRTNGSTMPPGINLGDEVKTMGGLYSATNRLNFYVPTGTGGDMSTPFVHAYAKTALTLSNGLVEVPSGTTLKASSITLGSSNITAWTDLGTSSGSGATYAYDFCGTNRAIVTNSSSPQLRALGVTLTNGLWEIEFVGNFLASTNVAAGAAFTFAFTGSGTYQSGSFLSTH